MTLKARKETIHGTGLLASVQQWRTFG